MLNGLIRQSQEAEIKGERDSQDRLRKAGQDWSKARANNPMPKIAYVARCLSIPITDTIPASQGTVRGTQLSKTHGQLGSRKGKTAVSWKLGVGVLAGYLGGQEAALALEAGNSCCRVRRRHCTSILRFVSGIALP